MPTCSSTSLRTDTMASSKSNPVGTFCLLPSNPPPTRSSVLNTSSRRERGAPEVQTDARGARQQDPKALAQIRCPRPRHPLTMQGSGWPGTSRRTVQLCGSHLTDPFFPQLSYLECTVVWQSPEGTSSKLEAKIGTLHFSTARTQDVLGFLTLSIDGLRAKSRTLITLCKQLCRQEYTRLAYLRAGTPTGSAMCWHTQA